MTKQKGGESEGHGRLLEEIAASVSELAARAGITSERAFAAWYAISFLDVDEDDALESAALDGGEDQSIDLLFTDELNERILVLQAHFPQNREKAAPKSKFDGLVAATTWLEDPSVFRRAGRPELAAAAEEARPHLGHFEVLLGVVSLGARSEQITRSLDATNKSPRFSAFRFFYDSGTEIIERYKALKAGGRGVAEGTLVFEGRRVLEDQGEYGRAWVGSVPASELARLYQENGDRLFARNVRLFLGSRKGGINEQIIETARAAPGRFWALNNGITIVADTVTRVGKPAKFKITRFSIVNGCQTTVSLIRAGAPAGAKVLTRLVAANDAVVAEIVRYNNTQNAVRIWTVRAADSLQERLRVALAEVGVNYAPKPEKGRILGGSGVVVLDRLAQYLAAREVKTIIPAVKEKSELFDRYYQDIFPHDARPEDVYMTWLLGNTADEERREKLKLLQEQGDADRTLTAFLGVAGTFWTILTSSKLIQELNQTPLRIDIRRVASEAFKSSLRKYVRRGLDVFLDIAIDTYDPEEYRSIRSALRSPKFLQRYAQKLANKAATAKRDRQSLPKLDGKAS